MIIYGSLFEYVHLEEIYKDKQIYIMQPRVYELFEENHYLMNSIKHEDEQIIIWLPTFRQLSGTNRKDSGESNPLSIIKGDDEISELSDILKRNHQVLFIKKHPREKDEMLIKCSHREIRIISDEDIKNWRTSLNGFLAITDALITDYSGIAFEYMIMDKPIGYVVSDFEKYHRGFSVENPIEYMPGEMIKSFYELVLFLNHVRERKDLKMNERRMLCEQLFKEHKYENGAESLVRWIDMQKN